MTDAHGGANILMRASDRVFLATIVMVIFPAVVMVAAEPTTAPVVVDRVFEELTLGEHTFTDATVFSKTDQHVTISHAGGLISLKVADLDSTSLKRLGYEVASDSGFSGRWGWVQLDPLRFLLSDVFSSGQSRWFGLGAVIVFICLTVGFYLYTSYLFWLICIKTETTPGISVWLPFLQAIPMLKAARMSGIWAVILLALAIGSAYGRSRWSESAVWFDFGCALSCITLWVAWSLRICQARRKSALIAILLFLPVVNYFALMHLAGSK